MKSNKSKKSKKEMMEEVQLCFDDMIKSTTLPRKSQKSEPVIEFCDFSNSPSFPNEVE